MTKVVLVVLALTIGGLVAWWHWAPRHVAQELRRAGLAGDTAAVARLVNVPAMRQPLAIDWEAALAQACHRTPDSSAAGRSRAFSALKLDFDRIAWPRVVTDLAGNGRVLLKGAPPESSRVVSMTYARYPTTYALTVLNLQQPSPDTVRFLFRRDGLAWRVAQLQFMPITIDKPAPCQ
jgi:hypothetical protein